MTDKEKIMKYLDYKGLTKNKFYVKTGLSVGFLDKGASLGVDKLKLILEHYPDLNMEWLITGKGKMILEDNGQLVNEPAPEYQADDLSRDYINTLKGTVVRLQESQRNLEQVLLKIVSK